MKTGLTMKMAADAQMK